jgi:hypothetical protein
LEAIVPFKDSHCLVATNFHNGQMINLGPTHIGNGGMAKIMESKI